MKSSSNSDVGGECKTKSTSWFPFWWELPWLASPSSTSCLTGCACCLTDTSRQRNGKWRLKHLYADGIILLWESKSLFFGGSGWKSNIGCRFKPKDSVSPSLILLLTHSPILLTRYLTWSLMLLRLLTHSIIHSRSLSLPLTLTHTHSPLWSAVRKPGTNDNCLVHTSSLTSPAS